jgi:hypothetical protein
MMQKVTQKKLLAAEHLAGGAAATKAASAAGVSRNTISRWIKDAEFMALVRQREAEQMAELSKRITALAALALDVCEDVIRAPGARHGEKLRAAAILLQNFTGVRELTELEARIARLEQEVL